MLKDTPVTISKIYPMFLFLSLALNVAAINKTIEPKSTIKFVENLTEDDQQVIFTLSNLSKDYNLRYKITPPANAKTVRSSESSSTFASTEDEDEDEDTFGDSLKGTINKSYSAAGTYQIQIHNAGKSPIEFSISSNVHKKVSTGDKDVMELRNLLNSLQTAIEDLGNENYFLKNHQVKSISEAKFITRSMNWLLLFPILTVVIGYFKYVLARQLVKPKGKRFKGLF